MTQSLAFEGRVALVTGASSGIGRAAAKKLGSQGARVALIGRKMDRLKEVASAIGPETLPLSADVTVIADAERVVAATVEHFGGLDILVNAAGILAPGSIENTSLPSWDETMNVNLRAVFHLMTLAVPHLSARRGNIVNVSSINGMRSFPGVLAYCVSKAAVDQLTRCAALELAAKGVRVNAVNPGVVLTNLQRRGGMDDERYAQFLERSKTTHPMGRVGHPEEIADLIAFLASDQASWMTGVTATIDGGRALTCAR